MISGPFVLVLDDAHRVIHAAARRVIERLMLSVPVGSQVVLAARNAIAPEVSRVADRARTQDIGARDLADRHRGNPHGAGPGLHPGRRAMTPNSIECRPRIDTP